MAMLHELMAEEEKKLEEKAKAEIAAERAAWDALPQHEKDRINAERDAWWDAVDAACGPEDEADDEEDY